MFRSIDKSETFPQIEHRVLAHWKKDGSFEKSLKNRENCQEYSFYDGPPFATGLPHYGHLLAGTIKDIIPRYWTMKGRKVPRHFGWDCHGLPIESLIQNELKLAGVSEIREFGEARFNEACRSAVLKYTDEWEQTVERMGRWVDFRNDYKTMDASFMESVWWVFRKCWEKGLIYQGHRIQPYSPSLATPLSNFETNQGYMDRQDPSVTLSFSIHGRRESFLVWTTTPWTLPSNMALAVGPDIDYLLVEYKNKRYWLAESRLPVYFKENFEILNRCKGRDLADLEYEPLFRFMENSPKLYRVQQADFVGSENGTGIVHIAPSFGEDDFRLGQELGLPLFDPLDEQGCFTSVVPDWQGLGAKEADKDILATLKEQGRVFRHETLVHSYPHCWRTGVPLLYRALKTWFLRLDVEIESETGEKKTLKEWMIHNNRQIGWVPSHIRDGRFGKWLHGARDWNISRNRFWGTPIPVWESADGDQLCVGSIEELMKLSGKTLDDLHKHHVDPVEIRTKDGKVYDSEGKSYRRIDEVFDCWFESGSMPYAQKHFPFENGTEFSDGFPADFIAEGLDQTRGWFYTLTVLSSALFQKPAFKNVVVNGIVLAENGQKMSKSLKNYPDPNLLLECTGADAIRLFLINSAAVKGEDLKFSEEGVTEIVRSILLPLWNAVSLFITYANADAFKGQLDWKPGVELKSSNELDRWILALQQELLEKIEREMQAYHLYNVVPAIVDFIDSLTNWYLRRSRRRFWKSDNDEDKNFAYATLHAVLVELSRILAPFLPFLAEEIFQILQGETVERAPSSVHLSDYPVARPALKDEALVGRMSKVRSIVNMGRVLRAQNLLKNRQPLSRITVVTRSEMDRRSVQAMEQLLLEELNVQELAFSSDESDLVSLSAKANFKKLGRRMGKSMKEVATAISSFSPEQVNSLQRGGKISIEQGEITLDDILVQREVRSGLVVEADEYFTVALDTEITEELEKAGIVRELVNRIQNRRKELDFSMTARIRVKIWSEDALIRTAASEGCELVKSEVQADVLEIVEMEPDAVTAELNGKEVLLKVEGSI